MNALIINEGLRCYNQIKGHSKEQTHLEIKNIEINMLMEAKLTSSGVRKNNSINPIESLTKRIYLHVYRQEIFCFSITYLQLVK